MKDREDMIKELNADVEKLTSEAESYRNIEVTSYHCCMFI